MYTGRKVYGKSEFVIQDRKGHLENSGHIPVGHHHFSADGSAVLVLNFIIKLCTNHLDFQNRISSLFMHPASQRDFTLHNCWRNNSSELPDRNPPVHADSS